MKATAVHYNHQTGLVTAEPHPAGRKFTVTEDATSVRLIAGDDVAVSIDSGISTVESLTAQPLLIEQHDGGGTIKVKTARLPEGATPAGKSDRAD